MYFSVTRSAISIPPWINPLYNLIDEHLRVIEEFKDLLGDEGVTKIYEKYFSGYPREEFDAALTRRLNNIQEFTEIKRMEYDAITHHNDPVYASNKKHFKAEEESLPEYLKKYFSRMIRITRLREVKVLLGFTRVDAPDPDADEQANIVYLHKGKNERWLPAVEINGEGIFIEFNQTTIKEWLNLTEVRAFSQRYAESYKEFCASREWNVTVLRNAVYVLLHTFSHLLIKQMSIITTDGYENASKRYDYETVRKMIERQKEKYGWEFLFLGANIDAAAEAKRFGISADRAVNYKCDEEGTALNYEVISEAVCSVRACKPLSADWKKRIDEDVKKRGK